MQSIAVGLILRLWYCMIYLTARVNCRRKPVENDFVLFSHRIQESKWTNYLPCKETWRKKYWFQVRKSNPDLWTQYLNLINNDSRSVIINRWRGEEDTKTKRCIDLLLLDCDYYKCLIVFVIQLHFCRDHYIYLQSMLQLSVDFDIFLN